MKPVIETTTATTVVILGGAAECREAASSLVTEAACVDSVAAIPTAARVVIVPHSERTGATIRNVLSEREHLRCIVWLRQDIEATDPNICGAIKGSQPIWGGYAPFTYPNWATKFFVDAMLLLKESAP